MDRQNFNLKTYEAASDDELRPLFMCVHFKNGFIYATDGHILLKQSLYYHSVINPEFLEGKSIHRDNFKNIMQFEFAECTENGILCKDGDGRTAVFDYYDRKDSDLPDFEKIFKDLGPSQETKFIGIHAKLLERLAKAMYSPHGDFRFKFHGYDKGILIDVVDIPNQMGFLMPVILNDVLF